MTGLIPKVDLGRCSLARELGGFEFLKVDLQAV